MESSFNGSFFLEYFRISPTIVTKSGEFKWWYAKCESIKYTKFAFDKMSQVGIVLWNAMIARYFHHVLHKFMEHRNVGNVGTCTRNG